MFLYLFYIGEKYLGIGSEWRFIFQKLPLYQSF